MAKNSRYKYCFTMNKLSQINYKYNLLLYICRNNNRFVLLH